jgi:hypothetical protein
MPDILFVTPDLEDNSMGRTYCLWLLARANDWTAEVVSPAGRYVWRPLAGTEFEAGCRQMTVDAMVALVRNVRPRLIIGVKSQVPSVLAFQRLVSETATPGLIDVDDPDLEAALYWSDPIRRLGKEMFRATTMREFRQVRPVVLRSTRMVSNPVLQARYGGVTIPHVRPNIKPGARHVTNHPVVAFVGNNRAHKGLSVLRSAVKRLQPRGFSLVVTDNRPADAQPWERWVGFTTLTEGIRLVQGSDIVSVPSLRVRYTHGQLPVKIIDAMLAARPLVVSDVDPMPWAVGQGGLIAKAGSIPSLTHALGRLADPSLREELGRAGRQLAVARYTVEAQRKQFRAACEAMMSPPRAT